MRRRKGREGKEGGYILGSSTSKQSTYRAINDERHYYRAGRNPTHKEGGESRGHFGVYMHFALLCLLLVVGGDRRR